MSSASAVTPPATGGHPKSFFCHRCDRTVIITLVPSTDPLCPHCNEGFLEEYESSNPSPNNITEAFFADPFSSFLPFLFPPSSSSTSTTTVDLLNPSLFSNPQPNPSQTRPDDFFDPFLFLHNHLNNLRSGGAQIQFVIENHPSDSNSDPFRLPANIGDYFVGPGLEQLIQQLAENDPNRYGTPPASKSAVSALPTVKVTEEIMKSDMNQCAVCQDDFDAGMEVKQMPCNHVYHSDCLLPWLELHNSCPVCRYELPTDDSDYESCRNRGGGSGNGSDSGDGERGGENISFRRSFSIMLPFPFRGGGGGGSGGDGGQGHSAN